MIKEKVNQQNSNISYKFKIKLVKKLSPSGGAGVYFSLNNANVKKVVYNSQPLSLGLIKEAIQDLYFIKKEKHDRKRLRIKSKIFKQINQL